MKKFLFFACLAMVMVGCKKEAEQPQEEKKAAAGAADADCNYIKNALTGKTVSQQVSWLRQNTSQVCTTYLSCIEGFHTISRTHFETDTNASNSSPNFTDIALKDLLSNGCSYDKYLYFKADSVTGKITFTEEADFVGLHQISKTGIYSKALFHSIKTNHNLDPSTTMVSFAMAKDTNNFESIYFKIDGVAAGFYDFSRVPPAIPGVPPIAF